MHVRLGPTKTLNDVDVPVRRGVEAVKMDIDTVGANRAMIRPYPFDIDL